MDHLEWETFEGTIRIYSKQLIPIDYHMNRGEIIVTVAVRIQRITILRVKEFLYYNYLCFKMVND